MFLETTPEGKIYKELAEKESIPAQTLGICKMVWAGMLSFSGRPREI